MDDMTIRLASRWKRLGGVLIDSILSMIITIPIMLATGVFQSALKGETMSIGEQVILIIVGWFFFLALHGYLLCRRGQTIGKYIVKTKIVDMDGNVPDFGKLLVLRYLVLGLVYNIPFIGPPVSIVSALFIFGKERRCGHDYLAGTRVVNV